MHIMKSMAAALAVAVALGFGLVATAPLAYAYTTDHKHKKAAVPLHIGQVAKDGGLAFTVTGVQCGVKRVGAPNATGEAAPAGEQWCLATMNVKAYKRHAQSFSASEQRAVDSRGNQIRADDSAAIYIPNNTKAEYAVVQPGTSITAVVPFLLAGFRQDNEVHPARLTLRRRRDGQQRRLRGCR